MKRTLKCVADVIAYVVALPLYLGTRLLGLLFPTDLPFQMTSHFLSLWPGVPGNYVRRAFYRLILPRCGPDVCIEFGTILHQPTVELGRRVYIGTHCSIGESTIEDDVLLGSNVDIISGGQQHYFDDLDRPIREQGGRFRKIVVGPDSWIGNSSVVMANVGAQSIVAAGSVVVRDVERRSIVAGNPAALVRKR